jgi:outer membrane lipoprotein-sorting protein
MKILNIKLKSWGIIVILILGLLPFNNCSKTHGTTIKLSSYEGTFVEKNLVDNKEVTERGAIYFKKPSKERLERYSVENNETKSIEIRNGRQVTTYYPKEKMAIKISHDNDKKNILSSYSDTYKLLKKESLKKTGSKIINGRNISIFELTTNSTFLKKHPDLPKRAVFHIDDSSGVIVATYFYNEKETQFFSRELTVKKENITLDDSLFEIELPEKTNIINLP